jgi:hypothetical protein
MSAINADTAKAWQAIADRLSVTRPSTGKTIRVSGGRKHKGKVGIVEIHQISHYTNVYRYGNEASHHMRDLSGREGWVCRVRCIATGESFWIAAEHVDVIKIHTDGDGNETIEVLKVPE